MDAISNPKTNPSLHECLMVVLYNHIKNTTIQLSISEVFESEEDLGDLDDDDIEGYDIEVDAEVDPHITESRKRKRKIG